MKRITIFYCLIFIAVSLVFFSSCKHKGTGYQKIIHDPMLYNQVVHKLNYVIIFDIFTPPVASRVFAYSNLAAYEVLAKEGKHFSSLQGKITGLNNIPNPASGAKIDYPFAALMALIKVGNELTFSNDTMKLVADSVKALAAENGMPEDIYNASIQYGNQVADSILAWGKKDNYGKTRGKKFTVSDVEGHWSPTPPGYFGGVEPLWPTIRCMAMDSANMYPPPPPPTFSKDTSSPFYNMAKEVMLTVNTLDSTKKWIANFWDCNSFKLHVEGHMMFATKAMTPPGHWMEITGTVSRNNNADFYKTVYAYAATSISMFDGFICCWYTKYKTDVLRPETYINKYIDQDWRPYLQTPPFPEYNSAHSTISAAAATILGTVYKEKTAFKDSSEREWGWPDRHFATTDEAAIEVSLSRFYGGIHYRGSVNSAYVQGKKIGQLVLSKLGSSK